MARFNLKEANANIETAFNKSRDKVTQDLAKKYNDINMSQKKTLEEIEEANKALEDQLKLVDQIFQIRTKLAQEAYKEKAYAQGTLDVKRDIVKEDLKQLQEDQRRYLNQKSNNPKGSDAYNEANRELDLLNERIRASGTLYDKLQNEIKNGKSPNAIQARLNQAQTDFNFAKNMLDAVKNNPDSTDEEVTDALFNYAGRLDSITKNLGGGAFGSKVVKALDAGANLTSVLDGVNGILGDIRDSLDGLVDSATEYYKNNNQGRWESRLQGLNSEIADFSKLTSKITNTLAASGLVKATDYLQTIENYAAQGIAYNLEQRALVGTLGEKLLSTFDTTNKSLLQMIRLQQADMTYSSLGAEAQLTQFLNRYFQDTSYLTDMYDAISASLVEAASTMSRENATSFQYAVQKWMAALYSVGMNESAVNTIASGLNTLATGGVSALNSNDSLRTLFGLSAQSAGLSLSEILSEGLNADNVNDLMEAMVTYLQTIADNTSSQVVKSQYAEILGINLADLRAVSNLTQQDIKTTYNSTISYAQAMNEYANQMSQITQRTHISDLYDTLIDNVLYTFGNNVADNEAQYATWKITGAVNGLVESLGLDSSTTVKTLMAIVNGANLLVPAIETVYDFVSSMKKGAMVDTNYAALFGFSEYTDRGTAYTGAKGVGSLQDIVTGLSYSATATSQGTSSGDRTSLSFAENASKVTASTAQTVSDIENSTVRSVDDLYAAIFDYRKTVRVDVAAFEPKAVESLEGVHADKIKKAQETLDKIAEYTYSNNNNTIQVQSILRNMRWGD